MERDTEEDQAVRIFIGHLSNYQKRRTTNLINLSEIHLQTVIKSSEKHKDNLDIHDDEEMLHETCLLE